METSKQRRPRAAPGAATLVILIVLAQVLLSACSITVGAPPPTPGPNEPTNTPVEQVHFDVTPVPSPTGVPPTATPAPLPAGATAAPGGIVKYTIKPGDTLSGIALEFGITVDDIVKANNMTDPNAIQAGQVINIPTKGSAPSSGGPSPTPTNGP